MRMIKETLFIYLINKARAHDCMIKQSSEILITRRAVQTWAHPEMYWGQ